MKKLLLIVLGMFLSVGMYAQNATSSPFSRFGYGELNDNQISCFVKVRNFIEQN